MKENELVLNGSPREDVRPWIFQPALLSTTEIVCKDKSLKQCNQLLLGDELSTGRIVGIGKRLVYEWTELPSGAVVTPSTLLWNTTRWVRAGTQSEVYKDHVPRIFYTFVVLGTAAIELSSGEVVRDMCEIHSPEPEGVVRAYFSNTRTLSAI
jgi:hypothetical protein